jgi:hypothetical protein
LPLLYFLTMSGRKFSPLEKSLAYENNWKLLKTRYPMFKNEPHYMCESCGFVAKGKKSKSGRLFMSGGLWAIDHVKPQARGGEPTRVPKELNDLIDEAHESGDPVKIGQVIDAVFTVGYNAAVLCRECNGRKYVNDWVPDDAGYAYSRHVENLNPDARENGPPVPHPRTPKR